MAFKLRYGCFSKFSLYSFKCLLIFCIYIPAGDSKSKQVYLPLVSAPSIQEPTVAYDVKNKYCQPISVSLCNQMPYNMTSLPNILGHHSQEEAGMEVHKLFPLVKMHCSKDLYFFLCSVYLPVCTTRGFPLPPCRPLCLEVKQDCENLMRKFGFRWPESLNCNKFPDEAKDTACVGRSLSTIIESSGSQLSKKSVSDETWESVVEIASPGRVMWRELPVSSNNIHNKSTQRTIGMPFICPLHFTVPKHKKYSIRIGGKVIENCGAPCDGMFFTSNELNFSRKWVGGWAIVSLISCSFAITSFLINVSRFHYPERPIIFISICYWFIAGTYVVGLFHGTSVACDDPSETPHYIANEHMISPITQGVGKELCTVMFLILYFFTMAANIWWVVLTITWFLAAGLKWSHEALVKNSIWFHVAAWAIPAIKAVIILATENIEGDVLTGVCFVGLWNVNSMRGFVLAPLFLFLVVGTCFLVVGFVSLFRIRTILKHDGARIDKLERFMVRIGAFSVLYTVPAGVVVASLFYEQLYHEEWTLGWQWQKCRVRDEPWVTYNINCPPGIDPAYPPTTPPLIFFLVKYLSTLVAGISTGLWVCTGKTFIVWRDSFRRLFKIQQESQV